MDWQVIILTLGASLITGLVSLIGNIVVSKSNLQKIRLESNEQFRNEYMKKRFKIYELFLNSLQYIEEHISEEAVVEQSCLEQEWIKNYQYCSKRVNKQLKLFIQLNKKRSSLNGHWLIFQIRDSIKKDCCGYCGIKEKE